MATNCETELKVITWNINGLKEKYKNKEKTELLFDTMGSYDIILLQETHFKRTDGDAEEDLNGYEITILLGIMCPNPVIERQRVIYKTSFTSRSRGVAIVVNKPHKCLKAYSEGGDFAWVYIEIEYVKYTFVSVYYQKDEGSDLMCRILHSFLIHEPEAWTKSRLVIGGDFNTTLDPVLDLGQENPQHNARREKLKEFMRIVELKDVWREKNPEERKYTYSCEISKSRLDYVFMLQEDLEIVQNCNIPEDQWFKDLSNHFPVVLTLSRFRIRSPLSHFELFNLSSGDFDSDSD